MAQNMAAWLEDKGVPLRVADAPMPVPGSDDIVIKNHAIAINPLDWHMQDSGIFVKHWPAILGCDIAGEVYGVGQNVTRFKKGDRVIG
jgi:NADPH:quinone reductase-like Zn-dependent oxidoreductase